MYVIFLFLLMACMISKKRHINPYKQDVFVNQKYYKDAMARADLS